MAIIAKIQKALTKRTFSKKTRLAVIFVEYDRQVCGGSEKIFQILQGYVSEIDGCETVFLRVDNKNTRQETKRVGRSIHLLGGDNQFHEFSGWQKGLATLKALSIRYDLVLFVNDMFLAPGPSFLPDYISCDLLLQAINNKQIIGRIDSTFEHYTALDYDTSRWVCTNCFLAPKAALDAIGDLVSIRDNLDDILPIRYPGPEIYKVGAPLNTAYKKWLVEWLTQKWHSRFPIEEETWPLFRAKVRNILNESLLTARFVEAGFKPQMYGDKVYY